MRKHSRSIASRFSRDKGDRSNVPQHIGHQLTNDKRFQLAANSLLRKPLGPFIPKKPINYGEAFA